jgi:hypothetical protein
VGAGSPEGLKEVLRDEFFSLSGAQDHFAKLFLLMQTNILFGGLMEPAYQLAARAKKSRVVW